MKKLFLILGLLVVAATLSLSVKAQSYCSGTFVVQTYPSTGTTWIGLCTGGLFVAAGDGGGAYTICSNGDTPETFTVTWSAATCSGQVQWHDAWISQRPGVGQSGPYIWKYNDDTGSVVVQASRTGGTRWKPIYSYTGGQATGMVCPFGGCNE